MTLPNLLKRFEIKSHQWRDVWVNPAQTGISKTAGGGGRHHLPTLLGLSAWFAFFPFAKVEIGDNRWRRQWWQQHQHILWQHIVTKATRSLKTFLKNYKTGTYNRNCALPILDYSHYTENSFMVNSIDFFYVIFLTIVLLWFLLKKTLNLTVSKSMKITNKYHESHWSCL